MKRVKLYSYKSCGTCKKAIQYLDNNAVIYELVDITANPPKKNELTQVLKGMGGNIKKLFNTSGLIYRNEEYAEKLKSMTEADALSALSQKGKLIKRPVLLASGKGICGFKQDVWDQFLDLSE